MKIISILILLAVSIIINADTNYYYDSFNNKIQLNVKYKNYLSYDIKQEEKVKNILEKFNIEIKEWRKYKNTKILKLNKDINKEINEQLNKNDITTYKYFGKNDTWPVIIMNKGVLSLNSGYDINKLSKEFDFIIISYIKAIDIYIISKSNILSLLNELKESNIAKISQPDFLIPHEKRFIPNDEYFPNQWHLSDIGNMSGVNENANISATDAWDIEMGNPDIVIAIVDDGMDINHPDLSSKIIAKHDFLGNDEDVGNSGNSNDDAAIHGTACAGVSAAIGDNNEGTIGSCPKCSLISARMIGEAPSSNYSPSTLDAQAIIWASGGVVENATKIDGADIISCSWGFQQPISLPYSLKQAIDWSVTNGRDGKGCVVLFASGNDGREYNSMELEAYQNIITVGASTDSDKRAYYSNYGMKLDLLAPSNGGRNGIWTTDYQGTIGYNNGMQGPDQSGNYTKTFGGTSSATPLVSGTVGLILSKNPDLKWKEVRDILRASSDKINKNTINYINGWDKKYGYGRLNAYKALKLADSENFNDTGENCNENSDCYFNCIPETRGWKDGYCSNECEYSYCIEGSICIDNIAGLQSPQCLKICNNISECKEGYACSKLNTNNSPSYCIPGCSTKGCKGNFKICNKETELCENDVDNLCWNKNSNSPKICSKMFTYCNEETGDCECINKYFKMETGECTENLCLENTCVDNSTCDPLTGVCVCNKNYKENKNTGECVEYTKNTSSCSYTSSNSKNSFLFFFMIFLILILKTRLSSLNF